MSEGDRVETASARLAFVVTAGDDDDIAVASIGAGCALPAAMFGVFSPRAPVVELYLKLLLSMAVMIALGVDVDGLALLMPLDSRRALACKWRQRSDGRGSLVAIAPSSISGLILVRHSWRRS